MIILGINQSGDHLKPTAPVAGGAGAGAKGAARIDTGPEFDDQDAWYRQAMIVEKRAQETYQQPEDAARAAYPQQQIKERMARKAAAMKSSVAPNGHDDDQAAPSAAPDTLPAQVFQSQVPGHRQEPRVPPRIPGTPVFVE